jgi:hypothetical protein
MRSRARGRQFREGLTVLRGAGARSANERGPEHAGRPGARRGGRKMRGAGSGAARRMPGRRGWPEMCPAGSAGQGLPGEGGGFGEPAPSPGREGPGHAGAGLCRLHDNSPASCTTRHRSTDRYPKRPYASVGPVLPDFQPGTGCCMAMASPRWWERPSLQALLGGNPGQYAAGLRRERLLPGELVELSVSYPSEKCVPFVRCEPENWTGSVLAVPDADLVPGQTCHLDTVTVGQAQGALSPVQI